MRKAQVDRYGRPLSSEADRKALERFYRLDEADDDDEVEKELRRIQQAEEAYDPARHGGFDESSSSEEESSSDESDIVEEDAADVQGDQSAIPVGAETHRIALVNMDWDNIRAMDLFAVASSLCPTSGRIESVVIYPSEYGRERMEREQLEGPPKELFSEKRKPPTEYPRNDEPELESPPPDDPDGNIEASSRALRNYQISRLRYYYAIITSDTIHTASTLYAEMDGREYLSSANFFDLRFVPDEVTFEDPITDKPRDACHTLPSGYKPNEFVTEALTHSRIKLTWDAEDKTRQEVQKRAFSRAEIDDNDLKAYIGSDNDSDSERSASPVVGAPAASATNNKTATARAKTRALLGLPAEADPAPSKPKSKEQDDMQITFSSGLSSHDASGSHSIFANKPEDVREESTREQYIRKERDRKAKRKERAKAARKGLPLADASAEVNEDADVDATPDAHEPVAADAQEDEENGDPFNDPFFTDPAAANAALKKEARKAEKRRKQDTAAADAEQKAAERENLRKMMADNSDDGRAEGSAHFNMADIKRREKEATKKGKHKKKRGRDMDEDGEGREDDFELDLQDPRFKGVFERNEFAIDPTNPRFSGTRAMKAVLEEGRKRRAVDDEGEAGGRSEAELDGLVAKTKRDKKL